VPLLHTAPGSSTYSAAHYVRSLPVWYCVVHARDVLLKVARSWQLRLADIGYGSGFAADLTERNETKRSLMTHMRQDMLVVVDPLGCLG
jgi:hypothetical protein